MTWELTGVCPDVLRASRRGVRTPTWMAAFRRRDIVRYVPLYPQFETREDALAYAEANTDALLTEWHLA